MFRNCYTLKKIAEFNTENCVAFQGMLEGCVSLEYVPNFDTSSGGIFTDMLSLTLIRHVLSFDKSNGDNIELFSEGRYYTLIKTFYIYGMKETFSLANKDIDIDAIINVFNNLAAKVSRTITVTAPPELIIQPFST